MARLPVSIAVRNEQGNLLAPIASILVTATAGQVEIIGCDDASDHPVDAALSEPALEEMRVNSGEPGTENFSTP